MGRPLRRGSARTVDGHRDQEERRGRIFESFGSVLRLFSLRLGRQTQGEIQDQKGDKHAAAFKTEGSWSVSTTLARSRCPAPSDLRAETETVRQCSTDWASEHKTNGATKDGSTCPERQLVKLNKVSSVSQSPSKRERVRFTVDNDNHQKLNASSAGPHNDS